MTSADHLVLIVDDDDRFREAPQELLASAGLRSVALASASAAHLGISEVTVQIHRANVMRKMEADSLADLVRMAGWLDIAVSHSRHV